MSALQSFDFLELCVHLKSEWTPIPTQQGYHYQHSFSTDQSEVKYLTAVSMKQLDHYSNREAYSFPFCPRIYKYIIEKNRQRANELIFDVIILVERVSNRLSSQQPLRINSPTTKLLCDQVSNIIKGFQYLFFRFGPFCITEEMIGWTELGVVKVWLNADYSLNRKLNQPATEQTMVQDLVKILQNNFLLKKSLKKVSTFQNLLLSIELAQFKKEPEFMKRQVDFKPTGNLNASTCHIQPLVNRQFAAEEQRSSKSRKNITFSYSNKDIYKKPTTLPTKTGTVNKRSSIQIDMNDPTNRAVMSRLSAENKSKQNSPITSFKLISQPEQRKQGPKKSFFKAEKDEKSLQSASVSPGEFKAKRLEEHFSKTTQSSINQKDKCLEALPKKLTESKGQLETLHYSTSSNPCKHFFHPKRTQGKTYSTKGNNYLQVGEDEYRSECSKNQSNKSQLSQGTTDQKIQLQQDPKAIKTFQIDQQDSNMRESQQVQRDLQALFVSSHSFDQTQLQNELDCIL